MLKNIVPVFVLGPKVWLEMEVDPVQALSLPDVHPTFLVLTFEVKDAQLLTIGRVC
jgi:hypothetical protein